MGGVTSVWYRRGVTSVWYGRGVISVVWERYNTCGMTSVGMGEV